MASKGLVAAASSREIHEWEVEDALRTLTRAEEIRANPKMMAKVKALAKKKLDDLQQIAGQKK